MVNIPKVPIRYRGGGRLIGKWFSWKIFAIFLVIILIGSVITAIKEKDVTPVIKELGSRLLSPTAKISTYSNEVIGNEGLYQKDIGFLKGVWQFLRDNFVLLSSLYIIYLWIGIFYSVFDKMVNISPIINIFFAMFVFIIFQMLFLLMFTPQGLIEAPKTEIVMVPIMCFVDFARAMPYIIKPVSTIAETIVGDVNNVTM